MFYITNMTDTVNTSCYDVISYMSYFVSTFVMFEFDHYLWFWWCSSCICICILITFVIVFTLHSPLITAACLDVVLYTYILALIVSTFQLSTYLSNYTGRERLEDLCRPMVLK